MDATVAVSADRNRRILFVFAAVSNPREYYNIIYDIIIVSKQIMSLGIMGHSLCVCVCVAGQISAVQSAEAGSLLYYSVRAVCGVHSL